jgi:LPS export ABC transporter protein LptC
MPIAFKYNTRFFGWYFNIFLIFLGITSCENNIEVIKNITNVREIPSLSGENFEILYSDSGKVKMKVIAKVLNKYNSPDKQYIEFPKGIIIYKYDSAFQIESSVKADWAMYKEKLKLWEARNAVEAKNLKTNEQLFTEELFWDQNKHIIYSKKFTKIINPDGVFYGDGGFESNENLSKWHLIGVKGKVNIKDSKNGKTNP